VSAHNKLSSNEERGATNLPRTLQRQHNTGCSHRCRGWKTQRRRRRKYVEPAYSDWQHYCTASSSV